MTAHSPIAACIYLIRHATPNWSRKDIPYDIPPGPGLTPQGEMEATRLGEFIRQVDLRKLYHSPLERACRTAEIAAGIAQIPIQEIDEITELRAGVTDEQYAAHLLPVWDRVVAESRRTGPLGLVTHGGPIRILLQTLGLSGKQIESYKTRFDGKNPLPPAGVWQAELVPGATFWRLTLVFVPAIWETNLDK